MLFPYIPYRALCIISKRSQSVLFLICVICMLSVAESSYFKLYFTNFYNPRQFRYFNDIVFHLFSCTSVFILNQTLLSIDKNACLNDLINIQKELSCMFLSQDKSKKASLNARKWVGTLHINGIVISTLSIKRTITFAICRLLKRGFLPLLEIRYALVKTHIKPHALLPSYYTFCAM